MFKIPDNPQDVRSVEDLFARVSDSIIQSDQSPEHTAERLRKLPELLVYSAANAATDEDKAKLDSLVHKFRMEAEKLISDKVSNEDDLKQIRELCERGERELTFRDWEMDDLEIYHELLDDPKIWTYLPENYPDPLTVDDARRLIEFSGQLPERHRVQAVVWEGNPVGQVRLQFDSSPYPESAEISYWTGRPFWGKGLTSATVARFTLECFRLHKHIDYIFAEVLSGNEASIRLLEKSGYHRESFKYRNITKSGGEVFSTHVLAVHRMNYIDSID